MKFRLSATACALALVAATASAGAQTRPYASQPQRPQPRANQGRQAPAQFDAHARQNAQDWYTQHQNQAPIGLRSRDRLSPDQESRLQPGRPLPPDIRRQTHTVPRDLARQLPPPPPNHRYVAVGQHVGLVDNVNHILRDIIHLHGQ